MSYWLSHVTGYDGGGFASLYGGFLGDLGELTIIGVAYGHYKMHQCGEKHCWRWARYQTDDQEHVCRHHHPDMDNDAPDYETIKKNHRIAQTGETMTAWTDGKTYSFQVDDDAWRRRGPRISMTHKHKGKPIIVVTEDTDLSLDEAVKSTILRTEVGSGVHGVTIEGTDDRDEMAIICEPPDYVVGLKHFEHLVCRTAGDHTTRSGHDDLDLTFYSLRKWMRLALAGNPTVLLPLFAPEDKTMVTTPIAEQLRGQARKFVSERTGEAFLGYMNSQRRQASGEITPKHVKRPELVAEHGFDTKFAYHAIRVGLQGIEFLKTGTITLPMHWTQREWLLNLRKGEFTQADALQWMVQIEIELKLLSEELVGVRPDYDWANEFLKDAYGTTWGW